MKVLVIDGPNINMLGIREPAIYGSQNYAALCALIESAGRELGFEACDHFQSNHEGAIVDAIQQAYYDGTDGIIFNPAAYTHTSVALLDALKAVRLPAAEVHLTDIDAREDFRQVSFVRQACFATVAGEGIEGYRHALSLLADKLRADTAE